MGDEATRAGENPYAGRSPFVPRRRPPVIERMLPVLGALRGYRRDDLRRDVVAGLTVGALVLPAAMAFAELAGLPPVTGLYTAVLATIAYTLIGSSRQLIVGPEGVAAVLVGVTVQPLAGGDPERYGALAAALALLVGAVFVFAWILRLGFIADYFSRAVLVGYLTGVGVSLVIGQAEKLTGVPVEGDTPVAELGDFVRNLGDIDGATTALGVTALAALVLLRRFVPRLPGPLVVVVVSVLLSAALDFEERDIDVVGEIPAGLPALSVPDVGAADLLDLLPGAVGIFLVVFSDSILTARSFAGRHGQHIRAGQELLALGAANAAAGFAGGFAGGASGSRTTVNDSSGARTQLAGLVGAGFVVVVLLALTAPMSNLPTAVLGAVIVVAAIGLIEPSAWKALATVARREVLIAAAAAVGVLTVGVLTALVVAVGLALLDAILRSAQPHDAVLGYVRRLDRWADVSLHPSAQVTEGVVVYRLDGRLFFANANYVRGRIVEALMGSRAEVHHLVFDAEAVTHIDATGLDALEGIVGDVEGRGITFVVARARSSLMSTLATGGLVDRIGPSCFFPTVASAVDACAGNQLSTRERPDPS